MLELCLKEKHLRNIDDQKSKTDWIWLVQKKKYSGRDFLELTGGIVLFP
jgi:hypothetical protein